MFKVLFAISPSNWERKLDAKENHDIIIAKILISENETLKERACLFAHASEDGHLAWHQQGKSVYQTHNQILAHYVKKPREWFERNALIEEGNRVVIMTHGCYDGNRPHVEAVRPDGLKVIVESVSDIKTSTCCMVEGTLTEAYEKYTGWYAIGIHW